MQFKNHFRGLSISERLAFAVRVKSTKGHLQNIAYGYRPCSPVLAVAIEFETKGEVTRQELLPNDWKQLWPELVQAPELAGVAILLPGDALCYVGDGVQHG